MGYSLDGLSSSYKKEESIRLETLALIILVVVMIFVPWPLWKKFALVAAYLLVPLTELLNSAVEDVCDLVSSDFEPRIKSAKDKGSAAVLIIIAADVLVLVTLIII